MCAGGLIQAHFKHTSTTLIAFKSKKKFKIFFAKKLYLKFKKNQSLIEVCLKWTSSTPQVHFDYFLVLHEFFQFSLKLKCNMKSKRNFPY